MWAFQLWIWHATAACWKDSLSGRLSIINYSFCLCFLKWDFPSHEKSGVKVVKSEETMAKIGEKECIIRPKCGGILGGSIKEIARVKMLRRVASRRIESLCHSCDAVFRIGLWVSVNFHKPHVSDFSFGSIFKSRRINHPLRCRSIFIQRLCMSFRGKKRSRPFVSDFGSKICVSPKIDFFYMGKRVPKINFFFNTGSPSHSGDDI